jgi:hypothetical protein
VSSKPVAERRVRQTFILQVFEDDGPMELVSSIGETSYIDGINPGRPAERVVFLTELVRRDRNGRVKRLMSCGVPATLEELKEVVINDLGYSPKTVKGWKLEVRRVARLR